MNKAAFRRSPVRIVVALLGVGALAACQCSDSEVNEAGNAVGRVLQGFARLDSLCVADRVEVREVGQDRSFMPVIHNGGTETVRGRLRLTMSVTGGGMTRSTPGRYVLAEARDYLPGDTVVSDVSVNLPASPGTYVADITVRPDPYPAPDPENQLVSCHIRQVNYPAE